jgi:serine protease AprX
MNKLHVFIFIVIVSITQLRSQSKYWVRFKNKNGTPYTIGNPSAFLTNKAIQRRTSFNISVDSTDLPVTPSYITQINNINGVTVLYASKWLNGIVIQVSNSSVLTTVNSFSFVAGTNPVNRLKVNVPKIEESASELYKTAAVSSATFNYGGSRWQSKQIGVDCIHGQGYRGQGMTISVLDAGFLNVNTHSHFDSLKNRGGILGTRDFVSGGNNVYDDDAHGTMVLSCMAAIKPGLIMGSAPRANYWLLRTEDNASPEPLNETPSEEYNWIRAVEFSDSVGVDIVTTSLGYSTFNNPAYNHTYSQLDGKTINMSKVATMAARKGMLVLNSAGNEGNSSWFYISVPADADSICTVGAVDSLGAPASFSSNGPTADGRIKPDLVAGGVNAWVSYSGGFAGGANGTSFSCPILAGAMACYWQKHPTLNNIRIIDTLKKTASLAANPNNKRGWGIPNMCNIVAGINNELALFTDNRLFPVPCENILNVEELENIYEISICNLQGIEIKRIVNDSPQQKMQIDVKELGAGVYFARIKTDNYRLTKKFVKQ